MKILAFDTSLNKTYIALDTGNSDGGRPTEARQDNIITKIYQTDEKNYHSAYLIIGIKKILEENALSLNDIDLFAVNHGPGSFTGIRAGVTVAKTLAKELDKNVIGINSLDILYKTYQNLDPDVVLDARRGQFYYRKTNGAANREIKLIPYEEILNYKIKKTIITDTSGTARLREILKEDINIINFEDEDIDLSKALISLAKEAENKDDLKWNSLKAAYIQAPPIHKK